MYVVRQADDSFVCFGAKPDKGFWTWDLGVTGSGKGMREESWTKEFEVGSWRRVTRVTSRHLAERRVGMSEVQYQWKKTDQDGLAFLVAL